MEPTLEPCEAHAQFLAVVGIDSAMPLLYRCPDCEIYNIEPGAASARAQAVINKLMQREEGEL
jgi:hypothetical protein